MRNNSKPLVVAVAILSLLTGNRPACGQQLQLVSGAIDGQPVQGLEIIRAVNRQIILGTDGWIHDFDPRQTEVELQVAEGRFRPQTVIEMRSQLVAEFGRDFSVESTKHFLVVQSRETRERWADQFEQLHRTFSSYFTVRGVRVRSGNFPMVAIVMPDQAAMHVYLRKMGLKVSSGLLGVYDRASNRIVMYNHGADLGGVAATICHEAAHQSAFNSGVHSRFAETPHWIVEGIGCLFQSPAMVSGRRNGSRSDRIDPGLLLAYRSTYGKHHDRLSADIQSLISTDARFRDRNTIEDAYAAAWALTFYLSEREPTTFAELIKLYAARKPLEPYPEQERAADFLRISGIDGQVMALRVARFMDQQ